MIEELNGEPLHVCVPCGRTSTHPRFFVAHCLELDLMGDGSTQDEAISRLEKTIKIQYSVCEDKDSVFWAEDVAPQWIEYHEAALPRSPEDTSFVIEKRGMTSEAEAVSVPVQIDKAHRTIVNKDSWCNEYPLYELMKLLSTKKISWRPSEEVDYGYFFGHWPAGSDGPLQSYPFYAPSDTMVRWYHLRNIALRFCLDDLRSRLLPDNEGN
jgi:hypothetical protein